MTQDGSNLRVFFAAALDFLKTHQWLYNYPNTHILYNKTLNEIPYEWHHHLNSITNDELNNLPFGGINGNWPESLKVFIQQIQNLNYNIKQYNVCLSFPKLSTNAGISAKKVHEIERLAGVINDACAKLSLNCIVDVGAGLGHLSYFLYERYNYNVLAIEGNEEIYNLSLRNEEKRCLDTKSHVKYVNHFITLQSSEYIKSAVIEHFKDDYQNGVCITGLHACADLSVTILEIFRQLNFVKCVILMPCCYHRLGVLHSDDYKHEERFKHFPVSYELQTIYDNLKGWKFLRRFFLRLACQQTKGIWKNMTEEQHREHETSCMFRAVVQEAAEEENLIVKRLKRKTGKPNTNITGVNRIQHLIDNFQHTHELLPRNCDAGNTVVDYLKFKNLLCLKWNEHKGNCKLVEVLTGFQTAIQNVCENIVLLDRVCFVRETGLYCTIYKITEDNISPRCHVLIATKSLNTLGVSAV